MAQHELKTRAVRHRTLAGMLLTLCVVVFGLCKPFDAPAARVEAGPSLPPTRPAARNGPASAVTSDVSGVPSETRVDATRYLTIYVCDDSKRPVEDAVLSAVGIGKVVTDAGGLAVHPWEGGPTEIELVAWPEDASRPLFLNPNHRRRTAIAAGDGHGFCEWSLSRCGTLTVQAIGLAVIPEEMSVLVTSLDPLASNGLWRGTLNAQDQMVLRGMPPVALSVELLPSSRTAFMPAEQKVSMSSGGDALVSFDLQVARGSVRGVVVDQRGQAVVGITVAALPVHPFGAGRGKTTVTGDNGTFEILGLPGPEVRVGVDVRSLPARDFAFFGSSDSPWERVSSVTSGQLLLRVTEGATLRVRVPQGIAVLRPSLLVTPGPFGMSNSVNLSRDPDGHWSFLVKHLRSGRYTLALSDASAVIEDVFFGPDDKYKSISL
jgi:hypothetical protein